MEDFARFSIRSTALAVRGAIHSAEQTSAGSGVEAQALRNTKTGKIIWARRVDFIKNVYVFLDQLAS